MIIKNIIDEDFVNFKMPVMYIGTALCNGKCCLESNIPLSVCQNDEWRKTATIKITDDKLIKRYITNPISKAICFSGLEPFEQFDEMYHFIKKLRTTYNNDDYIVIYTGYYENEIEKEILKLQQYRNIIIKFGRYIPNQNKHFDEVLGVYLASDNQYAKIIS